MSIDGSCHCGNIKYSLKTELSHKDLFYRKCTCSFCTKQGAIYTSDPSGSLHIDVVDPNKVTIYRFSTKLIDFVFCTTCGVMPIARISIESQNFGVINTTTSNFDLGFVEIAALEVSNESNIGSIERRRKTWTPIF